MTPPETTRDQTILLGIVGGSSVWEAGYRAAVLALTRGRVAAVFSPQPGDAEHVAQETGGQLFYSLRRMIDRSGVRALLILESGWSRDWAIALATARQLPVFVASPLDESLPRVASALADMEAEGALVVPGARLRATPTSLRLRELIATKLGPIQQLDIDLSGMPGSVDPIVIGVIDWCRWLLNSTINHIHREARPEGETLVISCSRRSPSTPPVRAEIRLSGPELHPPESTSPDARFPRVRIRCQHGEVEILSASHLCWQTSTENSDEILDGDRPGEQVLLDLFLRRVVGGVVPVPSWAELAEACQLWDSVNPT